MADKASVDCCTVQWQRRSCASDLQRRPASAPAAGGASRGGGSCLSAPRRRVLFASACMLIPWAGSSLCPGRRSTPSMSGGDHARSARTRPLSGTVRSVSRTYQEVDRAAPLPAALPPMQPPPLADPYHVEQSPGVPGATSPATPSYSVRAPRAGAMKGGRAESAGAVSSQRGNRYMAAKGFTSEIHAIDRISREEEVLLSRAIQQSLRLRAQMSEASSRSATFENVAAELNMDDGEVREVFLAGLRARATLVTANLRLVQAVVNKVMRQKRNQQVSSADLMQEGILGLIRAAEKFDSSKGFAFSTYATIWIRSNISHSLKHDSAIIRVPQAAALMKRRVDQVRAEYKLVHGDLAEPSAAEMAVTLGVPEQRILDVLSRPILTSSSAFDVRTENRVHHLLADKSAEGGGMSVVERSLVAERLLDQLRRVLSPTEWEALVLRYGLLPEHKGRILTYHEVAELTNRTKAQSRHAVKMSVKKLQTPQLLKKLEPYRESF